ncbi:MAG: lysine--tRNA ligase, partial [Chloroflexi bacterium]|nr:lysine--tRNA ligase [Chloroflexota bacterium]
MAEDDLIALRKEKLERLRSRGIDPYPHRFSRSHTAAEAAALAPEDGAGPEATVAGRVTAMRDMGKAMFIDLRDGSGRIQAYFKQGKIGDEAFALLKEIDLGDFVGVSGPLFRTRTKEPTVEAHNLTVLAKALRPP